MPFDRRAAAKQRRRLKRVRRQKAVWREKRAKYSVVGSTPTGLPQYGPDYRKAHKAKTR